MPDDPATESNGPEPPKEDFKPPEEVTPAKSEDEQTNRAVDDIERKESDQQLANADAKHFEPPAKSWYKKVFRHKKIWIPAAVILVLVLLAVIPWTRYELAGGR